MVDVKNRFFGGFVMKIVADANIPFVKECFSSVGEVQLCSGREMSGEVVKEAGALLVRSVTKVDKSLLAGSKVKFVGTATIGFEHIDVAYLAENGIGFTSAPGSNANSVAEYIAAAMLSVAKKYKFQLEGKSIGIIGVGNVGSLVGKNAEALGMEVLLNDPPLARQTGDAKYLPLEELFGCDFVTMHTPLTYEGSDKTFHLAGEKFFGSLKQGVFFMNTSRGSVVDTAALKAAMGAHKTGGVVLDVWENEPNIDHELLLKVDLSTPHIAGYSFDGKVAGMIMIYKALCEQFGLEAKYEAADFLPGPEIAEIRIDAESETEQRILHQTVQQVYNINRDDFNTREILTIPVEQRGAFFDDLRKNYPVRREFGNTRILFEKACDSLAAKLSGIGFGV